MPGNLLRRFTNLSTSSSNKSNKSNTVRVAPPSPSGKLRLLCEAHATHMGDRSRCPVVAVQEGQSNTGGGAGGGGVSGSASSGGGSASKSVGRSVGKTVGKTVGKSASKMKQAAGGKSATGRSRKHNAISKPRGGGRGGSSSGGGGGGGKHLGHLNHLHLLTRTADEALGSLAGTGASAGERGSAKRRRGGMSASKAAALAVNVSEFMRGVTPHARKMMDGLQQDEMVAVQILAAW
jgi:hypothetical protein